MAYSSDSTLDLVRRINKVQLQGTPVTELFHIHSVSLWSLYQFNLLEEVKKFMRQAGTDLPDETSLKKGVKLSLAVPYLFIMASSVLALLRLWIFRAPVLVYNTDNVDQNTKLGTRLGGLYAFFRGRQVRYEEFIHASVGKVWGNAWQRRKPVFYLEFLFLLFVLSGQRRKLAKFEQMVKDESLADFAPAERPFVRKILIKGIAHCLLSSFKVRWLSRALSLSAVKKFITIDDVRHSQELVLACQRQGISSYWFQHSNFEYFWGLDTLPPSSYAFPDALFVWNEYWVEYLPVASPFFALHKDRIRAGGRIDGRVATASISHPPKEPGKVLEVLVPYEVKTDKKELKELVYAVASYPEFHVTFKARTDIPLGQQIDEYGLASLVTDGRIRIVQRLSHEDIEQTDLVLGVYSTFLDDMIEVGKPVVVFGDTYPSFHNLAKNGLGGMITGDKALLRQQLIAAASISQEDIEKRRDRLFRGPGDLQKTLDELVCSR